MDTNLTRIEVQGLVTVQIKCKFFSKLNFLNLFELDPDILHLNLLKTNMREQMWDLFSIFFLV